jgi:hypothetical protein
LDRSVPEILRSVGIERGEGPSQALEDCSVSPRQQTGMLENDWTADNRPSDPFAVDCHRTLFIREQPRDYIERRSLSAPAVPHNPNELTISTGSLMSLPRGYSNSAPLADRMQVSP